MENSIYKIGNIVVHISEGVCIIKNICKKDFGTGEKTYIILNPYYKTSNYNIYVEMEKSVSLIREALTKDDAKKLISDMKLMKPKWIDSPKERKVEYSKIYHDGDIVESAQLIKTLYMRKQENKKKLLSVPDSELLQKLQKRVFEELAVALEVNPDNIPSYIEEAN